MLLLSAFIKKKNNEFEILKNDPQNGSGDHRFNMWIRRGQLHRQKNGYDVYGEKKTNASSEQCSTFHNINRWRKIKCIGAEV